MKIELSRTMRPRDYEELAPELRLIDEIQETVGPAKIAQHPCRRWECAMAWRALSEWMEQYPVALLSKCAYSVSDWGCGTSLLPASLFRMGFRVELFEPWTMSQDESGFIHQQMGQVMKGDRERMTGMAGSYFLTRKALGETRGEYANRYDVSFCISTLEHIRDEEKAFRELCGTVHRGGMVFVTVDFAADHGPHEMDNLRERIYTSQDLWRLVTWAAEEGLSLTGRPDWSDAEECWMVYGYGFASLSLQKN